MREGWKTLRLGEICTIDKVKHDGAPLPYVGLEHVESDTGKYLGDLTPTEVKSATFRFSSDHVLYGRLRPYLNKVLLPDFDGHCSSEIFPLKPRDALDRRFLYYWVTQHSIVKQIDKTSTGARMPRANVNQVMEFQLSLPPMVEQKRIVAILDEAFEGIDTVVANTEQNLANARELLDSTSLKLFEAVGDRQRFTLHELLELRWITGHLDGNHGSDYPRKSEFVSEGVPYISANCIKSEAVDFSLAKYLSHDRAADLRKGVARNRDVLFAHNATVGPVAMLYTDLDKVVLSTSLTYYRCDLNRIFPEYLANYMRTPFFKRQYETVMAQSTRNQVPITKQREFYHLIPSLDEQKAIAGNLDALRGDVEQLTRTYRQKLTALAELKQSLLQKVFSGELTAREAEAAVEEATA
ncbi:restriction endonuclease subunit S [Halomonas sp.]|uniref:restriction endonuclease subunit S n=1 Tax=Halomonas sp. TaxID=1486246 RepID=UPI00298EB818|nr:restriction endonuclease subunit S [Halomonas sp.]MDW7745892.1 restriction endonuclease subunit S [Halomonas sp.]